MNAHKRWQIIAYLSILLVTNTSMPREPKQNTPVPVIQSKRNLWNLTRPSKSGTNEISITQPAFSFFLQVVKWNMHTHTINPNRTIHTKSIAHTTTKPEPFQCIQSQGDTDVMRIRTESSPFRATTPPPPPPPQPLPLYRISLYIFM